MGEYNAPANNHTYIKGSGLSLDRHFPYCVEVESMPHGGSDHAIGMAMEMFGPIGHAEVDESSQQCMYELLPDQRWDYFNHFFYFLNQDDAILFKLSM